MQAPILNEGKWLVAEAPNTTTPGFAYYWTEASDITYSTQASGWGVDPSHSVAQFGSGYLTDTGSWSDFTSNPDNLVWRAHSASGNAVDWGADQFLAFSISASIAGAPEPSKAVFALLGLLMLGLRRRRGW